MLILVLATVLWAHWPAMSAAALSFDDYQYVADNRLVQAPGWASVGTLLSEVRHPSTVIGYYQPITMISLMVDYARGGRSNALSAFHQTNLALHLINTTLVILLLISLFDIRWPALLVGLLFGVHPLTVDPVVWVGERKTMLLACFSLLSLLAYVHYVRIRHTEGNTAPSSNSLPKSASQGITNLASMLYFASMLFYITALLAKPSIALMPLVLLLMDLWPLKRPVKKALWDKLPFLAIATISAIITLVSQRHFEVGSSRGAHDFSAVQIMLLACHNVLFYLCHVIWPVGLSSYYPFPDQISLSSVSLVMSILAVAVISLLAVVSLRWTFAFFVPWSSFLLLMAPTLVNHSYSPSLAWDKYVYLPVVALLWGLTYVLNRLWTRPGEPGSLRKTRLALATGGLLLAALEIIALRDYLSVWKTSETLFNYMISRAPGEWMLERQMGNILSEQSRGAEAILHYQKACDLNPNQEGTHFAFGRSLENNGRLDEAITHYRRVIEINPRFEDAYYTLGNALISRNEYDLAIEAYRNQLKMKPLHASAHFNLAHALEDQGHSDQSLVEYEKTVTIRPDHAKAHYNLANLLVQQGRVDEAIPHYRQAMQLNPDYVEAYNNLGSVLDSQGHHREAADLYGQAIQKDPSSLQTRLNLAGVLKEMGRISEALAEYRDVLKAEPGNETAQRSIRELTSRPGP